MSHWNYRVVNYAGSGGVRCLGLFAVYYDDDGNPNGRAENPADFGCEEEEGVEAIRVALVRALRDVATHPVPMDEEDFKR